MKDEVHAWCTPRLRRASCILPEPLQFGAPHPRDPMPAFRRTRKNRHVSATTGEDRTLFNESTRLEIGNRLTRMRLALDGIENLEAKLARNTRHRFVVRNDRDVLDTEALSSGEVKRIE